MLDTFLLWLADTPLGIAIAEDPVLFPWLETFHVLAVVTVFGVMLMVDLRLLGRASRDYPVSALLRSLLPVTWIAFAAALATGALMFCSNPVGYAGNSYFQAKLALILLAGANMSVFHLVTAKGIARWDLSPHLPAAPRLAGLLSMLLWIGVIVCGRWIGFSMDPF